MENIVNFNKWSQKIQFREFSEEKKITHFVNGFRKKTRISLKDTKETGKFRHRIAKNANFGKK